MTIALLCGTYASFSGIDRVVEHQAEDLVRRGHQVTILTFAADMSAPKGVTLVVVPAPKSLFWLRVYRLIYPFLVWRWRRDLVHLKGFQEVHVHQYPLTILGWAAKHRYHATYIFHDYGIPPMWSFTTWVDRLYIVVFRFLSNLTVRSADRAYTISHFLRDELKKTTGLEAELLPPTIDATRFHPGISGKTIRDKFGLADVPTLLFVGRVVPYKGVHLLIQVLELVRQKIPETRLLIVGNPTVPAYRNMLERLKNDHVVFAGYVPDDDLPEFYGACTIYVTASAWEGYDLPLVEAQACGKPVVAFAIGSHAEVINHHGKLVAQGDLHGFAEAILQLLEHQNS